MVIVVVTTNPPRRTAASSSLLIVDCVHVAMYSRTLSGHTHNSVLCRIGEDNEHTINGKRVDYLLRPRILSLCGALSRRVVCIVVDVVAETKIAMG